MNNNSLNFFGKLENNKAVKKNIQKNNIIQPVDIDSKSLKNRKGNLIILNITIWKNSQIIDD